MTQPLPRDLGKVGKYEIVEKIGEGGYSCVHRGFDPLIKRHVAIKSCASADRDTRERFYREAEIAGNLDHANIVRVYDLFIDQQTPYLVQELLGGEDLDERIERREPGSFSEKLFYLIQIARGLEYAHEHGVIHRDIKPANIRVLEDGTVKILDFGIAKLVHYTSDLTQKGMAVGTAAYLAPEQIRGEKASPATDIFSFGVLAYELLTHVRPFGRETISETFFQTLNHDPAPLSAHWADCPAELVAVVSRCLDKDPAERFASCTELLTRLEEIRERLRTDWAPEPNPSKTQALPAAADLDLRAPAPAGAGGTVQVPIDAPIRSRPSPRVDLPLQARPRGIRMAGAAHRRRSRGWIPLALLLAAAVCAWLWLPYQEVVARFGSWTTAAAAESSEPAPSTDDNQTPSAAAEPAAGSPAGEPLVLEAPEPPTATPAAPPPEAASTPKPQEPVKAPQPTVEPPGRLTVQAHLGSPQGLIRIGSQRLLQPTPLRGQPIEPGQHRLAIFSHDDRTSPVFQSVVDIRAGHEAIVTFDLEGSRQPHVREKQVRR